MNANITIRQLYYNSKVMDFFFRSQSVDTFNELIENCEESVNHIFDAIENYSDDLDEIEELFYSETIEDLADIFGLTLIKEEEE